MRVLVSDFSLTFLYCLARAGGTQMSEALDVRNSI
jgi:hypothetical protein